MVYAALPLDEETHDHSRFYPKCDGLGPGGDWKGKGGP